MKIIYFIVLLGLKGHWLNLENIGYVKAVTDINPFILLCPCWHDLGMFCSDFDSIKTNFLLSQKA